MKEIRKLIAFAVCLSLVLSLASCMDLGVGESDGALNEYFSKVHVLSESGAREYSFSHFNTEINIEDMDVPVVVGYEKYCYIGFRVADEYTLSLSEFGFFARTASGIGTLDLEFYIVDKMPTSLKDSGGNDVSVSDPDREGAEGTEAGAESDVESESEDVTEEDLFSGDKMFHGARFSIGEEWDSVLLQFSETKTVNGGEYVIIRIKNNCYSSLGDNAYEPIAFSFNYLLFYINSAHK